MGNLDFASVTIDKKRNKPKLVEKKEGEVSWEGYNTSDFEISGGEEEDNPIPEEFAALSKFKPHAKFHAKWAKAVDLPIETPRSDNTLLSNTGQSGTALEEDSDESDDWDVTDSAESGTGDEDDDEDEEEDEDDE